LKKRAIIGYAVLSLFVAAIVVIAWLVCTPSGSRLVVTTLFRWMPVTVEAERVTGQLSNELTLEGVRASWPNGEARISTLRVRLQPLSLLTGSVSMDEISVRHVSIVDDSPDSGPPYDLEWPRAPRLLAAVRGRIGLFRIEDATYRKSGKAPLTIQEGRGEVIWSRGSTLTLKDFLLRLPDAQAEGSVEAGFLFPSLHANLSIRLDKAVAKCDALSLTADLASGKDPEQVSGKILLSASSGTNVQARLQGEIGLTRKALRFRNLQLDDGSGRAVVSTEGQVDVSTDRILAGTSFRFEAGDAVPALLPLSLTGTLEIQGGPSLYAGRFTVQNEGQSWRFALLSGQFSGNLAGVQVTRMTGRYLEGNVEGKLSGSWDRGVSVTGYLKGRDLNPAQIRPELTGKINLNIEGAVHWPKAGSPEARVKGELLESRLRDRSLTGGFDGRWHAGMIRISRFSLKGAGFEAKAAGALAERLNWGVQVSDLSALMPGSAGRLSASGWARQEKGQLTGAMRLRGNKLLVSGVRITSVEADAEIGKEDPRRIEGRALLKGLAYGPAQISTVQMKSEGKVGDHRVEVLLESREGKAEAALRGSYAKAMWKGTLETLRGSDTLGSWGLQAPASLVVSAGKVSVSPALITSEGGEMLEFSMDMSLDPARGALLSRWRRVNLARVAFLTPEWQARGETDGHVRAEFRGQNKTTVSSAVGLTGSLTRGSLAIDLKEAAGKLEWNENGLTGLARADLGRAGRINARVTSPDPARPGLPDRGEFLFSSDHVDAALLQPWLPQPLSMTGALSCTAAGKLLPGLRLDASGEVRLSQGAFSLQDKKGLTTAQTEKAQLRWTWREKTLIGGLDLLLTNHGSLKAEFRLPVEARLPIVLDAEGTVRAAARADLREKGLLSALFPGLVQESRGRLALNCSADGTWTTPNIHGTMRVNRAGAYLPSTGIQLSDVTMDARFEDQTVRITSLEARSGPGRIEGTGTVWLKDRGIDRIDMNLSGERFQVVRLPEMEMLATPSLTFKGKPKDLQVRGSITIPELLIRGTESKAVARPSKDVVKVDESRAPKGDHALPLDAQVRVILGDRAFIRAEGVDARLEGDVLLTAKTLDAINAKGEIRLRDGTYSTRGVRLDITRGRVVFDGGPADQPRLDVLALRRVEERTDRAGQTLGTFREVKAGVIVTGTPLAPMVRLYSEPPMPDADILSYIVLGQPMSGGDASKSALLAGAAEALLSGSGSESTLSQLRRQFGPDTVDMKSKTVGGTTQSIVTVGKYLQPKLYVSYGRSLFSDEYYVTLRYTLSKRWEVESKAGAQTGANLYYRIEFD
jgi:translocation and assembly module TamB